MPCRKVVLVSALVASVVAGSGCTARVGNFTLISTKNVDLSDASIDTKHGKRITEDDCAPVVLIFPIGRPDLKEAVDNALEEGRGNLMVDQVSYYRSWYIPLIFGLRCMVAEGTVVDVVSMSR